MRRFLPVIILILLAPLIAELLWGSTPITKAAGLLFQIPIYGAGALLIRELVRRRQRGWASILLLGAAYGLVEEGLVIQSFFHPTLYTAFNWGARIFGINGVYSIWGIGYHAIWSIALPILLIELLFPEKRNEPYLGQVGLVITGICYVLGAILLGFIFHIAVTPGYWAPPILLGLTVFVVIVCIVMALFVLPPKTLHSRELRSAPLPWIVLFLGGIAGFLWQAILILTSQFFPTLVQGALVLIPIGVALVIAILTTWLLNYWARASTWGSLHLLALASGALIAHTIFGVFFLTYTTIDRIALVILGLAMSILLALFAIHLARGKGSYHVDSVTSS